MPMLEDQEVHKPPSHFTSSFSGHLPGYLSAVEVTKLHREEVCTLETNVSACNAWYTTFLPSPGCAAKEQHRTVSLSLACLCPICIA